MKPNDPPPRLNYPSYVTTGGKSAAKSAGSLRHSRLLGYAVAALAIGILFVALVIGLYWLAWQVWGSEESSTDNSSFSDKLGLAQVVAALVAT